MSQHPRRSRHYLIAFGAVLLVTLTACTTAIAGKASKADPLKDGANVSAVRPGAGVADDVTLQGVTGSETDDLVINAMSDLIAFWDDLAPEIFDTDKVPPLKGGVFAVDAEDPNSPTPKGCGDDDPKYFAMNAFYCPGGDVIVYDTNYMTYVLETWGELDVAFVFAHEYGHALQNRFEKNQKSIVSETQADCFTGAWAASVTAGDATYWLADEAHLDGPIGDYAFDLGDPAGQDPNAQGTHGGAFDRVSAVQEGYFDGPASCVSNFTNDRVFTTAKFDADSASEDGKGNVTLEVAFDQSWQVLEVYLADLIDGPAPTLTIDQPACKVKYAVQECTTGQTVDVSQLDELAELHGTYGDFSIFTLMTMAYTAYVEKSNDLDPSTTRQVCVVAALAAELAGEGYLSPGDLDEAVVTIYWAKENSTFVKVDPGAAWDRIDAFRTGYYEGLDSCKL